MPVLAGRLVNICFILQLSDESFGRMAKFAMETPCFSKQATLQANQELHQILPNLRHEINIDFTRTLNRLIFDKIVSKNSSTYPYIKVPKEEIRVVQPVFKRGELETFSPKFLNGVWWKNGEKRKSSKFF